MTQEELAEIMCVPKSTISAYENDKVDIKGNNVTATALGELNFEEPDFSIFSRGDIKMQNTEVNAPHGIFSGG